MSHLSDSDLFYNNRPINQYLNAKQKKYNSLAKKYLTTQLIEGRCALCLGAGVGKGVGLPLWSELITGLFCSILVHEPLSREKRAFLINSDIKSRIGNVSLFNSINTLESAEYIQLALERYVNIYANDTKLAYNHSTAERMMARDILSTLEFFRKTSNENNWSVLKSLAKLITAPDGIRQVLTYNYDDALEYACDNLLSGTRNYQSCGIRECTVINSSKELPSFIYHVHGRLPLFCDYLKKNLQEDINAGIILSERSYNHVESMVYNSTNTCQAQIFQTYSCLFIGFSAQDYNYKRIMKGIPLSPQDRDNLVNNITEGAECSRSPHFMIFSLSSFIKELGAGKVKISKTDEKNYKYLLQKMIDTHFNYYTRYNIWPIYIRSHADTYTVLNRLAHALPSSKG